jgi:hypothetical protein
MAEISLELAPKESSKVGFLILKEPIEDGKLATIETIKISLDGYGNVIATGATGFGYSRKGGTLLSAFALSREGSATFSLEIGTCLFADFPTFTKISAMEPISVENDQKADGILTTWSKTIPPLSIIKAEMIHASPVTAKMIDVYLVIQS